MFFKKRQQEFRSMLAEYDTLRAEAAKYGNYSYQTHQLKWLTRDVVALCLIGLGGIFIVLSILFGDRSDSLIPGLEALFYAVSLAGVCMLLAAPMLLAFCDSSSLSFLLRCDFNFLAERVDALRLEVDSLRSLVSTNSEQKPL